MEKFEIIGRKLIRYRGSEDEVTIPDGVEVIAEGAFRDCRDMCSVTLPEGLKRIENEAFQWCARLESVHAPESIEYIGQDVFAGTPFYKYYNENEVQWKDDFLFLGKCLFKARRNIREADIPEGTVSITADAFNERVLLSRVSIPQSVRDIGWRAFSGWSALAEKDGFVMIGYVCCGYIGDGSSITVPDKASAIAPGAFRENKRILFLTVPDTVEKIGANAFRDCRLLRELRLPKSISELPPGALDGCEALQSITAPGMLPEQFDRREDRVSAVIGFCRAWKEYSASADAAYRGWVSENAQMLLSAVIDRNMPDAVRFFTENALIDRESYLAALEKAQTARAMEIVALLLDYGKNLSSEDMFDKYDI